MEPLKILSKKECEYYVNCLSELQDTFRIKSEPAVDSQIPCRHSYNNIALKPLHMSLTNMASKHFGVKLLPSYSYARYYEKGSRLLPHTDRAACKYSMTLNISSSDPSLIYPIWFMINDKPVSIDIRQGYGVFYDGMTYAHWRERCNHDWYLQLFLHWMDEDSKDDLIEEEHKNAKHLSLWK